MKKIEFYHIGGLLEKFELIKALLAIYSKERNKFRDNVVIAAFYGCNNTCWGSGRIIKQFTKESTVAEYMKQFPEISCELVFTNALIQKEVDDPAGNFLLESFKGNNCDCIVNSGILERYISEKYGNPLISSITKVLSKEETIAELCLKSEDGYKYKRVIINGNFTKSFDFLKTLPRKEDCEILVNDVCTVVCSFRKKHYNIYDRAALGEKIKTNICNANNGDIVTAPLYKMMTYPLFVKVEQIKDYLAIGINHFKIQGRTNYDVDYIETLVYYLIKPEYQMEIRERLLLQFFHNYKTIIS